MSPLYRRPIPPEPRPNDRLVAFDGRRRRPLGRPAVRVEHAAHGAKMAAATLMGLDQPKVSHLLRGRLGGFSTQRLLECLTALGRDVEIVVRPAPKSRKRGRMHIAAA